MCTLFSTIFHKHSGDSFLKLTGKVFTLKFTLFKKTLQTEEKILFHRAFRHDINVKTMPTLTDSICLSLKNTRSK